MPRGRPKLLKKEDYPLASKPETNRIVDKHFIQSYGEFPVHNERYNNVISYLEDLNKKYDNKIKKASTTGPTEKQKILSELQKQQLSLSRLQILEQNIIQMEKPNPMNPLTYAPLNWFTGYRSFCGPNTWIYKLISEDKDKPYKFHQDNICRDHDIRYTKAKTLEDLHDADAIMLKELFKKYFVDFESNMMGKYKHEQSDNMLIQMAHDITITINYLLSLAEGAVSLYSTGLAFKNIYDAGSNIINGGNILRPPLPPDYADFIPRQDNLDQYRDRLEQWNDDSWTILGSNIPTFVGKTLFTTYVSDKLLALTSFSIILVKYAFEEILVQEKYWTGNKDIRGIIGTTKHEFTEEDENDIINRFKIIQDAINKESGIKPVELKEKDYVNYERKDEPIKNLEKDIEQIFVMNKTKAEKQYEMLHDENVSHHQTDLKEANLFYEKLPFIESDGVVREKVMSSWDKFMDLFNEEKDEPIIWNDIIISDTEIKKLILEPTENIKLEENDLVWNEKHITDEEINKLLTPSTPSTPIYSPELKDEL